MRSFSFPEEMAAILRLAAKFGKAWPWIEEYLHCFRSSADKPLKPARIKLFLDEILTFIEQGGFNIEKQWHVVRPNAIYEAVRYVAQANKTGFKNHNYLKKVAIGINQKMIEEEEKNQRDRAQEALRRDSNAPQYLKKIIEGIGKGI